MDDWHDSMTKLVKGDPVLAADVLREFMHVPLRKGTEPRPLPQVLSSKPPSDLIPDLVFAVGPVEKPARVIIVEIQSEMTAGKRRQWPRYSAALWLEYECPVDLLVICPDEATARACSRPLPTDLDLYTCRVKVLFPSRVPPLRTPEEVREYPGLGVLSLAYHGEDPHVTDAFVAGTTMLTPDEAKAYYDFAYRVAAPAVREMMEALMNTTYEMPASPTFRKHYEAGRADGEGEGEIKGEIKGERNAVRLVLKARKLKPTPEHLALIDGCEDLETLRLWGERGVTAASIDEIFK